MKEFARSPLVAATRCAGPVLNELLAEIRVTESAFFSFYAMSTRTFFVESAGCRIFFDFFVVGGYS